MNETDILAEIAKGYAQLGALFNELHDARLKPAATAEAKTEPKAETVQPAAESKPAKTITRDDVCRVLAEIIAKKSKEGQKFVQELLSKHGASKLSEVEVKDYIAIKSEAEQWLSIPF
jgi:ABC-type phosphate transport system substrate-binding protein